MNFKLDVVRSSAVASLAVALLTSCGGGTQIESFVPQRVIAFGDEASLIEADPAYPGQGRKYTVNTVAFDSTTNLPKSPIERICAGSQIWVQQLAYSYGFAFPECATPGYQVNGVMYAQAGATVAQLISQVDTYLAGNVASSDLVTVMLGVNDIIAAYENGADANSAVEYAGDAVGAQVVRITDRGAKVIVSTVPDMSFSPYATAHPGSAATLKTLSETFNRRLRLKLQEVRDGGRAVGLVLADEMVLSMVLYPGAFGLVNTTESICAAPGAPGAVPNCDLSNLDTQGTTKTTTNYGYDWLWADDTHLGANAQSRLGSLAVSRARNNPF